MSEQSKPSFQREKADRKLQVCVTESELNAIMSAANSSPDHRSVSDWARDNFVRPFVRRAERGGRL